MEDAGFNSQVLPYANPENNDTWPWHQASETNLIVPKEVKPLIEPKTPDIFALQNRGESSVQSSSQFTVKSKELMSFLY